MSAYEQASARARCNAVLESLELFRAANTPRSSASFILFLYACEHEGITVTALGDLAGLSLSATSRLVHMLTGRPRAEHAPGTECVPAAPLLQLEDSAADKRIKTIRLTEHGRAVRDAVEALIADARPIQDGPEPRGRADHAECAVTA